MPPESPLGMLPQDLRFEPPGRARGHPTAAVLFACFILLTVSCGVTIYGIYQMLQVVRFASMTLLQGLMIFFFAVSLAWIAFAAGSVHVEVGYHANQLRVVGIGQDVLGL